VLCCYATGNSEYLAVIPLARFSNGERFRGECGLLAAFLLQKTAENSGDALGLPMGAAARRSA
jgi:hypothetical protein